SVIEGDTKVCKDGSIKLAVKSGLSGSDYQWKKENATLSASNTLSISNVTEADAGEYTFSMKFDGCDKLYTENFTVEVGGLPEPNIPVSIVYLCLNSGETSLGKFVSATSDTYTLMWYKSDASPIGATPTFNPNLAGTTKYLVSQKSSTCESSKAELTVVVENPPAQIGANNVIFCTSDDAKPRMRIVNAGNFTYNLYTAHQGGTKIGSGTAVNDTATIEVTQDLVVGNNYFIETQNAHGCVSDYRTQVPVTIKESWIIGPEKVCFGDNLSLSADYSGGQIVWTKPDKSTDVSATLSVDNMKFEDAGVYSLYIKEPGLGCTMRDEIRVTVVRPEPPTVDNISYRYIENATAAPMTATPKTGFTLKWYNSENTLLSGQSPVPATNKTGAFKYYVSQDSLGCESPVVEVTVIVGTVPSAVPASDINVCIAEKPTVQIKNTIKDYTYTVYYKNEVVAEGKGNGASISLPSKVSILENAELGVTVSDLYNVSSELTKVNLISVNNLIDSQNSTSSVCDGATGKLTAVDITGAIYEWTTPTGAFAEQSLTITNASTADAGTYTLAVTASGCPVAKQTIELKVEKPAKPSTTKQVYYCKGDVADVLTATALSGYKLVWFDESHTQLPDAPRPNVSDVGSSIYYVMQVSVSDENCSSDREEITVVVEDRPEPVVLAPVNVCSIQDNTQPLSVRIPTSSEGYIYSLYSQPTEGSLAGRAVSAGDGLPVDIAVKDGDVSSNTVYYLEITNQGGCTSERTPVEITVTEISLSPDELLPYQVGEFYSQRLTTNAPNPLYEIVAGYLPLGFTLSSTGDISGTASEFADPSEFTVEVTSSLGCSVKKEYSLKSEILVSKMFSPNGDGINDIFMKGYKMTIFDRLGRKLFSGDDGWDGTYHGKVVPEDVYYYIIYYKDKDGTERRVTSYVTLIKMM
ncbi:MAG: gliding motility-associated C-terminal domain-containing protein, partial [Prevotellaceae bacterium]|nr:gliding motility-associated C-terminal domain-containing protein [Prevotellaceae bacterium]